MRLTPALVVLAAASLAATPSLAGHDRAAKSKITTAEVEAAQKGWSDSLLEIAKAEREGRDPRPLAEAHIKKFYAYELGTVLFKPTVASVDQFRGSFDEALQRLYLETQVHVLDREWEKLRLSLHTLDFFTQGPLLQAVLQPQPVVLLIDELDKVDQKFEALLLEILSDWQITVPKLGTVKAKTIPFVVMTSNQERRLGDPLRRRSLYKRIEHPDIRKEAEILDIRTVDAPMELKAQAVGLAQALRGYNLVKPPSIDEIVQFVRALQLLGEREIRAEMRDVLLPFLAKTEEDVKRLLLKDGFKSLVVTALKYRDEALTAMKANEGAAA